VFRFVSILGERYTHGHVFDFWRSLRDDPTRLRVLGDGKQEKSYLYVQDCIDAIRTAMGVHEGREGDFAVYNLGTEETLVVDDSVGLITRALGVEPEIEHTGGRRGWAGDSPLILLDISKMKSLGWAPRVTIPEAVGRTVAWLDSNAVVANVEGGGTA
jgi:UDP-glucose 4-epimerase